MLSLDERHAEEILARVPADAAELVRREMGVLKEISPEAREQVLREYRREVEALAPSPDEGSASPPLFVSCEDTGEVLAEFSVDELSEILQDEHPQFVCAVLSMMPADKSGQCINGFAVQRQIDVFCRMASLRSLDPRVREEVTQLVTARRTRRNTALPHPDAQLLAQVLDDAQDAGGLEPMEQLEEVLSEAPENLTFDDLMQLDDPALRLLLDEVEKDQLAVALRAASRQVRRRILQTLSTDTSQAVKASADALGPVHLGDVESAQAKILRILHRLEAAGDVKLKPVRGRGRN
jgi:flagellar motor switch protein FliG